MVNKEFLKTVKKSEAFIEKAQVKILDIPHAKVMLRCSWSILKGNEYKDIGEENILFCRKGYNSLIPLCVDDGVRCDYFKDSNSDADPDFIEKIEEELQKLNE